MTARAGAVPFRLLAFAALAAATLPPLAGTAAEAAGGGTWALSAPIPTPRSELAAAAFEGLIYVAGGLTVFGTTGAFEVYDPPSDSWRELAPLPQAVHHPALAAAGGRVYLSGGYSGLTFSLDLKGLWAYDPEADTWERRADMPGPRAAHAMAAIGDKLYLTGGAGPDARALWIYDPANDRWDDSAAPLPTAREHLAAAVHDGKLYVLGGRGHGRGNVNIVEVYDPAADRWRRRRDMIFPRGGFTAAALVGRIHAVGGEDLAASETFAQHQVYNPALDSWSLGAAMPEARHGLASAATDGRWYVVGGAARAGMLTLISIADTIAIFSPIPAE